MNFKFRFLAGLLFITFVAGSANASENNLRSPSSSNGSSSIPPIITIEAVPSTSATNVPSPKEKSKKRCHQSCYERTKGLFKTCFYRLWKIGHKKEKDDKVDQEADIESGLTGNSAKNTDVKPARKPVNLSSFGSRSTYSSASTSSASISARNSSAPNYSAAANATAAGFNDCDLSNATMPLSLTAFSVLTPTQPRVDFNNKESYFPSQITYIGNPLGSGVSNTIYTTDQQIPGAFASPPAPSSQQPTLQNTTSANGQIQSREEREKKEKEALAAILANKVKIVRLQIAIEDAKKRGENTDEMVAELNSLLNQ